MEVVVGIVLLQIGEILLPLQIVVIVSGPIRIIVIRIIGLRMKSAAAQAKENEQCNRCKQIFHDPAFLVIRRTDH
jgi:hypothetical protein